MSKKIALITGATAGIGEATAKLFGEKGYNLILTGRRKDRLDRLSGILNQDHGTEVQILAFDIRDRNETESSLSSLTAEWRNIDVLVNNAGLASGLDPVQGGDPDDWDAMIDTNIKGLLYLSRIVIPWMVENGKGHIFNIGSIAGREVYPRGNVYCATKHAVDAITKAMRIDLLGSGIRVTQIAPGAVQTEFSMVRFKGNAERANKVYEGYEPLLAGDIAEIIYFISNLPGRVNVNDILVMPLDQANATTFNKS